MSVKFISSDEDSEELDGLYPDFIPIQPSSPVNTRIIQTVPAKEPRLDAVPAKSALKKPLSVQEKRADSEIVNKIQESNGRSVMSRPIKSNLLNAFNSFHIRNLLNLSSFMLRASGSR